MSILETPRDSLDFDDSSQYQLPPKKVFIEWPEEDDDDEFRFVSSRIDDQQDSEAVKAPVLPEMHRYEEETMSPRYTPVRPIQSGKHIYSQREERLPVYGDEMDRDSIDYAYSPKKESKVEGESLEVRLELQREILYQNELRRRLQDIDTEMADLERKNIPKLDLLHMEEHTLSHGQMVNESVLDIDLRDSEDEDELKHIEESSEKSTVVDHRLHKHSSPPSRTKAEIAAVGRISKNFGNLSIEKDIYDSSRNPPDSLNSGSHSTPHQQDVEVLRKIKREYVYGSQTGPHQQMIQNENSSINPTKNSKPLPQLTPPRKPHASPENSPDQSPNRKRHFVKTSSSNHQQDPSKDFIEDNKRLPTNRLPVKSYNKIYKEKKTPVVPTKPTARIASPVEEEIYLDDEERLSPEQIWATRSHDLQGTQTQSAGSTAGKNVRGKRLQKYPSAEPRLQGSSKPFEPIPESNRSNAPPQTSTVTLEHPTTGMKFDVNLHFHDPRLQAPMPYFYPMVKSNGGQPQGYPYQPYILDQNGQQVSMFVPHGVPFQQMPTQYHQPTDIPVSAPNSMAYAYPALSPRGPPISQSQSQSQPNLQLQHESPTRTNQKPPATSNSYKPDVIDQTTLHRTFPYVGTKSVTMQKTAGKYHPLPPINPNTPRRINSQELDKTGSYTAKFQHEISQQQSYKQYNLKDFQKVKDVGRLGGLGADKDSSGYKNTNDRVKKKQEYAKVINERNRIRIEQSKEKAPPPKIQEPEEEPKQPNIRQRIKEYSQNLQPPPTKKANPETNKFSSTSHSKNTSTEPIINDLLYDPELEKLKLRHQQDKQASDSIRQRIAAT